MLITQNKLLAVICLAFCIPEPNLLKYNLQWVVKVFSCENAYFVDIVYTSLSIDRYQDRFISIFKCGLLGCWYTANFGATCIYRLR